MSWSEATDAPETAVRAALAAHDSTRVLADAVFEPVRGGLSNHAWKAEKDGRHWFVRLGGPESATLGVDRESERSLLAVVGAAGLAPKLVACDPSNGLLVTQFIEGAPWRREDARAARNLERIAQRLRVLHRLAPTTAIRRVDFAAQARSLEDQRCVPAPAIQRIADAAFEMLASRRTRLALCHNDLHHLNLLDDGRRLWIVDWEYGGVGDPLFDLASFACQHELAADERNALLAAYGAGDEIPASALDAACTAFDYVQWLWYSNWAARHPHAGREYALRAAALEARLAASGS